MYAKDIRLAKILGSFALLAMLISWWLFFLGGLIGISITVTATMIGI